MDTGLLSGNKGEYTKLGDAIGKIPAPIPAASPVKVPEINTDIAGQLDQPEMNIPGDLDTSGITSQVSFRQLGQKSMNSPGHHGHGCLRESSSLLVGVMNFTFSFQV